MNGSLNETVLIILPSIDCFTLCYKLCFVHWLGQHSFLSTLWDLDIKIPVYIGRNQRSERLTNLCKVTQLGRGRPGFKSRSVSRACTCDPHRPVSNVSRELWLLLLLPQHSLRGGHWMYSTWREWPELSFGWSRQTLVVRRFCMSILKPVRKCQGLMNCTPAQPSVQDGEMISNSPGMGVAVTLIPRALQ